MSYLDTLYARGPEFDFFQAVRLLELLQHDAADPAWAAVEDVARFRAHQSLSFPPSAIYSVAPPPKGRQVPTITVNFLGMTGPQGALPTNYTQLLLRIAREGRGAERTALRDWLDLFNHRLVGAFFRAWEKYRFPVPFLRFALTRSQESGGSGQESAVKTTTPDFAPDPDPFTRSLFNLIGLGTPALRHRLHVDAPPPPSDPLAAPRPLARIDDLALLHYAGLFAHKPRNAVGLAAIVRDYFGLPAVVDQFTGQWLYLEPASQSRLPDEAGGVNCELGVNAVAGERVWDVVSKFRICVGPLHYAEFVEFLPDPAPVAQRKAIFLLSQLVRLYVGMELDFEVRLALRGDEVPDLVLQEAGEGELGARLGWNTWMPGEQMPKTVDDAVFDAAEAIVLPAA
jgi:type VI secretion system protein ImpH